MIAIVIIAVIINGFVIVEGRRRRALREGSIQRALLESRIPPAWWPSDWRQELETSFTVEGAATVAGKKVSAGTVVFMLEPENRQFPAKISNGRYSLKHDRLPTGTYRVELKSEDGSEPRTSRSRWTMPIDQGFHRINLRF